MHLTIKYLMLFNCKKHCLYLKFVRFNHYDTLSVNKNSSVKEIKESYYKLSKQYHPDVNKQSGAEEKFKEIQAAYHVLSDETRKTEYDRSMYGGGGGGSAGDGTVYSGAGTIYNYDKTADYINELRYRRTVWKARKSKIYTGKTSAYDFDEYNRQHYSEFVKRRQEEIQFENLIRNMSREKRASSDNNTSNESSTRSPYNNNNNNNNINKIDSITLTLKITKFIGIMTVITIFIYFIHFLHELKLKEDEALRLKSIKAKKEFNK